MNVVKQRGTVIKLGAGSQPDRKEPLTPVELVCSDGVELFVHTPAELSPRAAVLYLHGKSGAFDRGISAWLPMLLGELPVLHVGVNMRSHSLGYSVRAGQDDPNAGLRGGMWEDIAGGADDVVTAVDFVRREYGLPVYLAGHSAGGFYVATGSARCGELAGRIALSPVIRHSTSFEGWFGAPAAVEQALGRAREMISDGDGHLLIPLPSSQWGISASALIERAAEPRDAWKRAMESTASPLLVGWGAAETRRDGIREAFTDLQLAGKRSFEIADAPHSYDGHESEVAEQVRHFLLVGLGEYGPAHSASAGSAAD